MNIMETVIAILAIFGLAFFLKESDGPWGLMAKWRNLLFTNKQFGVFFYKLFDCYFCLGFHCGWIVCLLSGQSWYPNLLLCWGLAGGIISLIFDLLLARLAPPAPEQLAASKPAKKTK